jgi:hypothetical protein
MTYLCPVCGYGQLPGPPEDYLICPSCGTEFGYDDFAATHDELRRRWVWRGAPWFATALGPPPGWSASLQLMDAGLVVRTLSEAPQITEVDVREVGLSAVA